MPTHSYEIKNSFNFFLKLMDEREDFLKDPTSSRHAINCAWTGWHLHEWVFEEYKTDFLKKGINDVLEFRTYLYKKCDSIREFRDLADGAKHFELTHRTSSILRTELKPQGGKWGPFGTLETPTLVVTTIPGVEMVMSFDDMLYSASFFWHAFFVEHLDLTVEINKLMEKYTWF